MELQYLLFDASDEESGRTSFDAMASVALPHLPALLREVEAVLRWAHAGFGPATAGDAGEWDYALEAVREPGQRLEVRYDARERSVRLVAGDAPGRITLTLTLSGSSAFGHGLREAFPGDD